MIEKYQKIIINLYNIGDNYYKLKTRSEFSLVNILDLKIKYGITFHESKRNKGVYPLIGSNGIIEYVDIYNAINSISFGCRGTLGNVFYNDGYAFILNTAFFINDFKQYGNLYFSLKHERGLIKYKSGAAQPQITFDAIKDVILKLPKNDYLNNIINLISNYEKMIYKLRKIKEKLLKKYF